MADLFTPYSDILKANPYHDARGRFTSGPSSGASSTKKPKGRPVSSWWPESLKRAISGRNPKTVNDVIDAMRRDRTVTVAHLESLLGRKRTYREKTRADLLKALSNWAKEQILNDQLHDSQAKAPL